MENATRTTKPDIRRTLTCAALAMITTLGMFSLVANIMTPMFSGIQLLPAGVSAQEVRVSRDVSDERVCVQTVRAEGAEPHSQPSVI
jgi:hypothetical protein